MKAIVRTLLEQGVLGVDLGYVEELDRQMTSCLPEGYQAHKSAGLVTRRFWRDQGLLPMWDGTNGTLEAQGIFYQPLIRDVVETCLLGRMSAENVVEVVEQRARENLTPQGVTAYQHYFFNLQLLPWSEVVRHADSTRDPHKKSAVRTTTTMAKPTVMNAMGLPYERMQAARMFEWGRDQAFFHFQFIALDQEPGPRSSKSLKELADTMIRFQDKLDESDHALLETLEEFRRFQLAHDNKPTVHIDNLTGGNFSSSGEGTDHDELEDFTDVG